jgi:hypothetical protein
MQWCTYCSRAEHVVECYSGAVMYWSGVLELCSAVEWCSEVMQRGSGAVEWCGAVVQRSAVATRSRSGAVVEWNGVLELVRQ